MIISRITNDKFEQFAREYTVLDYEYRMPSYAFDGGDELRLTFNTTGFSHLLKDLYENPHQPYEIVKMSDVNPSDTLLVKCDLDRVNVEQAQAWCERVAELYPERQVIAIPKDIDVSVMSKELLISLRDKITDIINNMDFNHLMSFDTKLENET